MSERNLAIGLLLCMTCFAGSADLLGEELGAEGYVDSGGVKLHYVTGGQGPLVVMIHGFPDYWYSWLDKETEERK